MTYMCVHTIRKCGPTYVHMYGSKIEKKTGQSNPNNIDNLIGFRHKKFVFQLPRSARQNEIRCRGASSFF
jgi:hypothetical protein